MRHMTGRASQREQAQGAKPWHEWCCPKKDLQLQTQSGKDESEERADGI